MLDSYTLALKKGTCGFTLIELMVTLSVAAILITIGIPSFANMLASNRVTAASNELVTTLNLAKSESIRSGQNSVLCKLNSAGNGCNNSGNWKDGWLLFNDADNDGSLSSGDQVIRIHSAPEASLNLTFANTANTITFRPNGTPNVKGHFCLQNSYQSTNSRAVLLYGTGRIRTEMRNGANNCA